MLGFYPLSSAPLGDDGVVETPVVSLSALPIASDAWVVGTATVGHVYALEAASLASAAIVSLPTLAVRSELVAADITSNVVVGPAVFAQIHAITAVGFETTAAVGKASVAQSHTLAVTGIATAAVIVQSAVIGQVHNLASQKVDAAAPAIAQAAVEIRAANPIYGIVAQNLATAPVSTSAAQLIQQHDLAALEQAAGPPTLPNARILQLHVLSTNGTNAGSVSVGRSDTRSLSARRIAFGAFSANKVISTYGPNQAFGGFGSNTLTEH